MSEIERIAYELLKSSGYTHEEIIELREAADHDFDCQCRKCEKLMKGMKEFT